MKRSAVYFVFSLFTILSLIIPSSAAEKMQIAVLELQSRGVSKLVSSTTSDIIRSEMVKTGLFVVVERGQMNEILKEQGFQQTGCTDQSCAVQLGKLLSARKILLGEVNKMGTGIMITVRIVDVEKGTSDFAATEKAENEDVLDKAGANITRKLADNIVQGNKEYFAERKTIPGYYSRCLVPGWGQFYAGRDTEGYVFMGAFALAAGYTIYSYFAFARADRDYNDLPRGSAQSEFDSKYDDKKTAGEIMFIAAGVTAAVYLAHWVDALFFSRPEFEDAQAYLGGQCPGFGLTLNGNRFDSDRNLSLGAVWRF